MSNVVKEVILDITNPGTDKTVSSYSSVGFRAPEISGTQVVVFVSTDSAAVPSYPVVYQFVASNQPYPANVYTPGRSVEWTWAGSVITNVGWLHLFTKSEIIF